LKQGLEKAKALHLEKILLTCKKDNVASSQVIMKNGGVLEKEYIEDGNVMLAYWIHIS
jgi:predicted acetyltransferase